MKRMLLGKAFEQPSQLLSAAYFLLFKYNNL